MVGVAPISSPATPSHSFCLLSGAWPHPARPTAGVPSARGIADHPHPQHPHMPSPAYLPHPAFYSPMPHPGMLYPYMPHPYPPPPAPMPDSPSRKRAGPEETQSSRNKRKRSNGRDSVESEPCVPVIGECTAQTFSLSSKWIAAGLYYQQAESGCADCCTKWYVAPWVVCASCTIPIWGRIIVLPFP